MPRPNAHPNLDQVQERRAPNNADRGRRDRGQVDTRIVHRRERPESPRLNAVESRWRAAGISHDYICLLLTYLLLWGREERWDVRRLSLPRTPVSPSRLALAIRIGKKDDRRWPRPNAAWTTATHRDRSAARPTRTSTSVSVTCPTPSIALPTHVRDRPRPARPSALIPPRPCPVSSAVTSRPDRTGRRGGEGQGERPPAQLECHRQVQGSRAARAAGVSVLASPHPNPNPNPSPSSPQL